MFPKAKTFSKSLNTTEFVSLAQLNMPGDVDKGHDDKAL